MSNRGGRDEMSSIVKYQGCHVVACEAISDEMVPKELTEGFLEFKFPDDYEVPSLDQEFMPIPRIVMNGKEGRILKVNEASGGRLDITVSFD
jgi:hypothetical protein